MSEHEDEVISPSHFKSIRLSFTMRDTSTGKEVKKKSQIRLLELMERGMILEMPAGSCKKGTYLVMTIESISATDERSLFKTGAKVEAIEPSDEGPEKVTLSLLQNDQAAWDSFCALFSDRQDEIEQFFKSVKGY